VFTSFVTDGRTDERTDACQSGLEEALKIYVNIADAYMQVALRRSDESNCGLERNKVQHD